MYREYNYVIKRSFFSVFEILFFVEFLDEGVFLDDEIVIKRNS